MKYKNFIYWPSFTSGVNNSTSSDGVYAELGRYPLQINREVAMIKYLKRLENLSDSRLIKKAFIQQLQDDRQGHYNWVSQINTIKNEFNVSTEQSDYIKRKIKEKYGKILKQNITKCLNQRRKLRTFAQFKSAMKFEKYLESVQNFSIRSCFSRFRLCAHDLEIERGRFNLKPLPIEKRICKQCQIDNIMIVEDKQHFLMHCPAHSSQRTTMMNKLTQKFPNFALFDESEQFVWMMSQDDSKSIKYVSNFIFSSMKKTQESTGTTAPHE